MKRIQTILTIVALGAGLALPMTAGWAQTAAQPAAAMSSGEVRKVDREAGKLTIKHGRLENLNMPAMTMAFKVASPAMLDQVKAGDKIRFTAEMVGGAATVTRLEAAR